MSPGAPGAPRAVVLALQLAEVPAAALFVDGRLHAAVREEVLTRRPRAGGFPSAAVDALLADAGLPPRVVTAVRVTGLGPPEGPLRRAAARLGAARPDAGPPGPRALAAALAVARIAAPVREVGADAARAALAARGAPTGAAALAVGAGLVAPEAAEAPTAPWTAPGFTELAAYRALSAAELPRARHADPEAAAAAALAAGRTVAWARGAAGLLDTPLGPRVLLRPGAPPALLVGPDGLVAHSPVDAVRAFRSSRADVLVLGDHVVGWPDG